MIRLRLYTFLLFPLATLISQSCYYDNEEDLYPDTSCDTSITTYSAVIAPIIMENCSYSGCHDNGTSPAGGLSLTAHQGIAGASNQIVNRINRGESDPLLMPRGTGKLNACDIEKIERWVRNGSLNN